MIDYKFSEDRLLPEIEEYINRTYSEHYAKGNGEVQAFELMMAGNSMRAMNFATMSALKYADRFGSKAGYNRNDLLKIVHFGILALAAYDKWDSSNNKSE